jgi:hypothetical protein
MSPMNAFLPSVKKLLIIPIVIIALVVLYCAHALLRKSQSAVR